MKRYTTAIKQLLIASSFIISLLVLQSCCPPSSRDNTNHANISSLAEYKEQRSDLIEMIRGETEQLNPQEKQASEQFEELKRVIYNKTQPATPWISKPFYEVKDKIAKTQLYRIIQQMPKGSILHLHPWAMGNMQTAVDKAMTKKDAHVLIKGDNRGMISFTSGKDRVAASRINEFGLTGKDLMECITIGPEDEAVSDIWPEFERIFGRMANPIISYPYEDYFYEAIEYFAIEDNISHIELREHTPQQKDIEMYKRINNRLAGNGIDISIRLIYCDTRQLAKGETPNDRCDRLRESTNKAIDLMEKHPDVVSGFDIYSEEDKGLPSTLMAELLIEARQKAAAKGVDFNLYLHGGESIFPMSFNATDEFSNNLPKYYNNNVIDVYLLGAKRIGHGFELAKLPKLADYYKEQGICVELCPISNQLLRYFKDLRNHPGINLFNQGVPITISPDDPAIFGYQGVSFDYWVAVMAWDMSLADVKKCIVNSIEYSSLNATEKRKLKNKWQNQWTKFIYSLIANN